jgi:hypothetical protein
MRSNKIIRYALSGFGIVDVLLFSSGIHDSGWLVFSGLLALFLGVTDFGRRCPLILSFRHMVSSFRPKHRPAILQVDDLKGSANVDKDAPPS